MNFKMTYKTQHEGDKNQHEHDVKKSNKICPDPLNKIFRMHLFHRGIGLHSPTGLFPETRHPQTNISISTYPFRLAYLPPFAISPLDLPWDPPLPYKPPIKHATQFYFARHATLNRTHIRERWKVEPVR
jgi:hypothetical protein